MDVRKCIVHFPINWKQIKIQSHAPLYIVQIIMKYHSSKNQYRSSYKDYENND